MNLFKNILSEWLSLFVDDWAFALAILAWAVACGVALPRLNLPDPIAPALLFGGFVAILGWSAVRRAGSNPRY